MSDGPESDSRDQEPSEKKIADAIERGETPVFHDLKLLGSVVGIYVALKVLRQVPAHHHIGTLGALLDRCWDIRLDNAADAIRLAIDLGATVLGPWAALILSALSISLVLGSAPHRPRIVWKRLKMEFSRLDPRKGMSRTLGRDGLSTFGKVAAKNMAAFCAAGVVMKANWRQIAYATLNEPTAVAETIFDVVERVALAIAAAIACFAILEMATSRLAWRKRLRMSRQEVKDELKQAEGDPLVKMRMRSLALDRARKRMLNEVGSATMVIANPTHFAVALRYLREEGGAPRVVAKGQELIALKIRNEAEQRQVPVIEQPELARAMYQSVEVGQFIPPEFYKAVAEIVNFLASRQVTLAPPRGQGSNKAS